MKRLTEEWKKHGPKNFRIFQRIEGNRSIITIADRNNNLVDQFDVPSQSGIKYCLDHPNGEHYRRLKSAADFAGIPLPPIEEKPKKQISQKIKNNRSTITVVDKSGNLVDQFVVPSQSGIRYCLDHPNGQYYRRLKAAATFAQADLPEPRQITTKPKKQISQKIKNNRTMITITDKSGNLVDQFDVPSQSGIRYCLEHPTGRHYKRLKAAATFAQADLPEPRHITARPKAKPKRQFNLQLEVDLLEKLEKKADQEGKSITGFIRELLEERLLDIQ